MSNFNVYTLNSGTKVNGGWTQLGDGEANKKMFISKNGITLKLNEAEICKVRDALASFDPRLY